MNPARSTEIVTCAREWIGTRFQHQGRCKRDKQGLGGVDCLGLLIGVAAELSLPAKDGSLLAGHDQCFYGHFPNTAMLEEALDRLMKPVDNIELPGVIGVFRIDNREQHLGIISDYDGSGELGIIHAFAPARKVVEHRMDKVWKQRLSGVWAVV